KGFCPPSYPVQKEPNAGSTSLSAGADRRNLPVRGSAPRYSGRKILPDTPGNPSETRDYPVHQGQCGDRHAIGYPAPEITDLPAPVPAYLASFVQYLSMTCACTLAP